MLLKGPISPPNNTQNTIQSQYSLFSLPTPTRIPGNGPNGGAAKSIVVVGAAVAQVEVGWVWGWPA
jgi:hypothetical protein